jgi:hypothetical protein
MATSKEMSAIDTGNRHFSEEMSAIDTGDRHFSKEIPPIDARDKYFSGCLRICGLCLMFMHVYVPGQIFNAKRGSVSPVTS